MNFSSSLPIFVYFSSQSKQWEYANFSISLGYWNTSAISYNLLYNGKTFFDGDGNSKIEVSRLLRNYTKDFKPVWDNSSQKFVPDGLGTTSISTDTLYPIEHDGSYCFGNGIFKIEIDDEPTQYIQASEMANQFYTDTNARPYDIWDTYSQFVVLQNYNRMYHCVNHIPILKNDTSIFGWFFGRNKRIMDLGAGAKTMLRANAHHTAIDLDTSAFGTYAGVCRVSDLLTALSIYMEDDLYITTPYNSASQYGDEFKVAHLDLCPRDFYVSWWDSCGWHCLGFDGSVETGNESENDSMVTPIGLDVTYATSGKSTFRLNSGYVEPEVVATIMTMKNAKWIYLNDTRSDKGQFCKLKGISGDGLTNGKAKPQNVQVELEEGITNKS